MRDSITTGRGDGKEVALNENPEILADLDPDFSAPLRRIIDAARRRGVTLRPYCGWRGVAQQAILWRQSRPRAEIDKAIAELRAGGADHLADVLRGVGPRSGPPVTNALPGLSWHGWGQACDLVVIGDDGAAVWDAGHAGYDVMADCAADCGLTSGHRWKMRDSVHVQFPRWPSPQAVHSLAEIDAIMRKGKPWIV